MGKKQESAPAAPDYNTIANAGRYNVVTGRGKSTWSTGPDGKAVQTVDNGDADKVYQAQQQANLNMANAGNAGLASATAKALRGLDTSGLPDWQQYNMDPTGNSKAIQDATYALLQPQRQQARDSEIVRLKNQGLTEDSPAFQRAMLTLNQGDTDAQLKALIAGQNEYGNAFGRNSQNNASSNALRSIMLGEQSNLNNYDLNQIKGLFAGVGNGGGAGGLDAGGGIDANASNAVQAAYKNQMDQYNAQQAKSGSMGKGIGGLLGAGASFFVPGGQTGALMGAGAAVGGGLGGLFG